MDSIRRSAVVVAVKEAATVVDDWLERTCADKPSNGVPAHITLLFPFVPAVEIDDGVIASLRTVFDLAEAFPFELREPKRFPAILYLAPEPALAFIRLTEALVARFPEHKPSAGLVDSIVPHLTVAHGDDRLLSEAEAAVRPHLPIRSEAHEALLLGEVEPNWQRWRIRAHLPFGG
jgi:2'-5' RNA ligase